MEKTYNPQFEKRIYDFWMKSGFFAANANPAKEQFSIMMPPPNITGQLHMGHALNQTVQDIITRFKRMDGFETLWLPGTDHASIATEVKLVEQLKKEGLTKADIGREAFLERAWKWRERYGGRITEQLKSLGTSCDWSKEAFTMDENCSAAVAHAFSEYYKKGLIYRGDRIINWCPSCRTALSDAEVEYTERKSHLWFFKYPLEGEDGYIKIATTRPETMLGDTAVAVNPKDKRYSGYISKNVRLPLMDRLIPIIADDYVETGFGTGAVKITPAHDPNDFEVGARHSLPVIRVMDDGGIMNENAGAYAGLDRYAARKKIVEDLEKLGLLEKIEPHVHNVGECYRCGETVEPIVSKQWFVKMKPLAAPAIAAVKSKKIEFIPKRFEKIYFNWMNGIKDWCISRQLWWGHRIPAYYCACGETVVSETPIDKCPVCGGALRQDEDVLDTWFSSALWPFSTLGYPKTNKNLNYFYPTSLLVTAYDIIFFWVARMIFSGLEFMGDVPFNEVLIHGIVRDENGKKMSKSLGNGVDPLELIAKYGADALRLSLSFGIAPGSDTRFSQEKIENCRNFCNKLWNAARFVIINRENEKPALPSRLSFIDKWILTKLNDVIRDVTKNLNRYEIGMASAKIYDFVWSEFCDWYIETQKPLLYSDDKAKKSRSVSMLLYVLTAVLKLLHPFAPFITEEIFGIINPDKSIMVEPWCEYSKNNIYRSEERAFDNLKALVTSIRNARADLGIAPSKKVKIYFAARDAALIKKSAPYIERLAGLSQMELCDNAPQTEQKCYVIISGLGEAYLPYSGLIDIKAETAKLKKEIEAIRAECERNENMLANENFVKKAPAKLVDAEREKLARNRERLEKSIEKLKMLEG
jgi:valyl-tRNA synthetase